MISKPGLILKTGFILPCRICTF